MSLGSQGFYDALKKLFVTDKDGHITIDDLKKWGGTPLTGRDITADIAPCTAIATIADVTAAAAATQLIVASTPCRSVVVRSLGTNTAAIRVGDSNVDASRGEELSPGDAVVLAVSNVNLVYVRGNATDKVSVTYVN